MNVKGLKQRHLLFLRTSLAWARAGYMEKAQKHLYPGQQEHEVSPSEIHEQGNVSPEGDALGRETGTNLSTSPTSL